MQCKYCQKELDEGVTLCPYCGESQEESQISKRLRKAQILLSCFVAFLLLVLLVGLVHYGVTGSLLPRKNDLHNKSSYTISADRLSTESGYKTYENKMDKVVATYGEHKMTNRMLQTYYWQIVGGSSYKDLDKSKPLDSQYQDPDTKTTWEQFFILEAIKTWQEDMAQVDIAVAAGFQMPEDYSSQFATLQDDLERQALATGYANGRDYLEKNFGRGVDFQTFYDYRWYYYYGGLFCEEYAQSLDVTMEQMEAYFQAYEAELASGQYGMTITKDSGKLVDVRHILVKISGGTIDESGKTVYSEEDWEACRVKAQEILDTWLEGEKTEESFSALATEKTEDSGSKHTGGLYESIYSGQMVEPFEKWCFDETRKPGDTDLVKTTYGYHVMYYVDGEEGWIRVSREGAKYMVTDEMIQQSKDKCELKIDYKNIVIGEME